MSTQPISRALATLALIAELGGIVLSIPLAALVFGLLCALIRNDGAVQ